jgi:hypothetical protein
MIPIEIAVAIAFVYVVYLGWNFKDHPRPQYVPPPNAVPSLIAVPGEEYYGYPHHQPRARQMQHQPRYNQGYRPHYR